MYIFFVMLNEGVCVWMLFNVSCSFLLLFNILVGRLSQSMEEQGVPLNRAILDEIERIRQGNC